MADEKGAGDRRKRNWIFAAASVVSAVVALLAFPAQVEQGYRWFAGKYESWGSVDLPGSYPGEVWKAASVEQLTWLEDEWCYPTIPGFKSRFRVIDGVHERQNTGSMPKPFTTEWWKTKTYMSNNGVLRIWYEDSDLPGNYVFFTAGKTAEWHENERYTNDDGSVRSGKKRLVLSCKRCTVSDYTYACE
jgi:hypothetical protein